MQQDLKETRKELKKLSFSCDLVQGALNQLEFLKEINSNRDTLFKEDLLDKACYRYESLWLPFYSYYLSDMFSANAKIDLVPPLDIEFIWHCHMLNPTEYYNDTIKICGKILEHKNLSKSQRDKQRKLTKPEWDKKYKFKNISFDYLDSNSVNKTDFANFKTNLKYDLIAACKRQINFYYQVSLPHYNNKKYLKLALQRYKKFLYLSKLNPTQFIVPCYSIDLLWHTHQLNPSSYTNDTNKILGRMLSHDDSVNERATGSKLNTSFETTCELWLKHYREKYFFSGGMFRGDKTTFDNNCNDCNFTIKTSNLYEVFFNKFENNEMNIEINIPDNFNLFTVKMKYIERLHTWSDIQLLQNEKLISSASLIRLNELPSSDLLPNLKTNLNTKTERAILLRNLNGDYAIVKGKLKSSILKITYHSLLDNSIRIKMSLDGEQRYIDFDFEYYKVKVDFKFGLIKIEINDDSLVKENKLMICSILTFVFSVISLYLPLIENSDYLMFKIFDNETTVQSNKPKKYERNSSKAKCGCFS